MAISSLNLPCVRFGPQQTCFLQGSMFSFPVAPNFPRYATLDVLPQIAVVSLWRRGPALSRLEWVMNHNLNFSRRSNFWNTQTNWSGFWSYQRGFVKTRDNMRQFTCAAPTKNSGIQMVILLPPANWHKQKQGWPALHKCISKLLLETLTTYNNWFILHNCFILSGQKNNFCSHKIY